MMKQILCLLTISILMGNVYGQRTRSVAFYNVENLFDTIDGPNDDAEFLPAAKNQWNAARYEEKLVHIREVLLAMGKPVVCGFSESSAYFFSMLTEFKNHAVTARSRITASCAICIQFNVIFQVLKFTFYFSVLCQRCS